MRRLENIFEQCLSRLEEQTETLSSGSSESSEAADATAVEDPSANTSASVAKLRKQLAAAKKARKAAEVKFVKVRKRCKTLLTKQKKASMQRLDKMKAAAKEKLLALKAQLRAARAHDGAGEGGEGEDGTADATEAKALDLSLDDSTQRIVKGETVTMNVYELQRMQTKHKLEKRKYQRALQTANGLLQTRKKQALAAEEKLSVLELQIQESGAAGGGAAASRRQEAALAKARMKLRSEETMREEAQKELASLRLRVSAQAAELEDVRATLASTEQSHEARHSEHADALQALEATLRAEHTNVLTELKSSHSVALEDALAQHTEQLTQRQAEALERVRVEHADTLASLHEKHAAALQGIRDAAEARAQELEGKLAAAAERVETLQSEHADALVESKKEAEKQRRASVKAAEEKKELTRVHSETLSARDKEIANLKRTVEEARAKERLQRRVAGLTTRDHKSLKDKYEQLRESMDREAAQRKKAEGARSLEVTKLKQQLRTANTTVRRQAKELEDALKRHSAQETSSASQADLTTLRDKNRNLREKLRKVRESARVKCNEVQNTASVERQQMQRRLDVLQEQYEGALKDREEGERQLHHIALKTKKVLTAYGQQVSTLKRKLKAAEGMVLAARRGAVGGVLGDGKENYQPARIELDLGDGGGLVALFEAESASTTSSVKGDSDTSSVVSDIALSLAGLMD